ncbi:pilus biogenesis protein [Candidatus Methylomirabilis lanthanidiphila]|uniref:Ribonuclease VapC n=1 Tax=Candidatus Methylomirabilis lanthanidiphila TaxID=2211376 RepID=A0A564ZG99_9BACT|nr:PIN domain nuclease [Candidatus Methylomirabilis lanthanidiphila]VUZ83672.1 pilus biogenesis protein [Candidatus Methylomirabilis lanthanidiphila]
MPDGWVLIDTSAWIHALRPSGNVAVREQIRDLLAEGRVATCEMIVLELAHGARTAREHRELCEDLEALHQFPITELVWRSAYRMAHTLRQTGLSVPAMDQLIAAVALNYSCSLFHSDKHFDLLARHVGLPIWTP